MAAEVDFIGAKDVKDDYDAIAFRILDGGRVINCVFDGGTSVVGDTLVEHLRAYYGSKSGFLPKIDYGTTGGWVYYVKHGLNVCLTSLH